MGIYSIVKVGEPVLREKAKPVKKVSRTIQKLFDNLADTMYEAQGVGLAAPQIGILKRVIVVDVGSSLIELANPEIISKSEDTDLAVEGCLSVPGVQGEVERSSKVTVQGLNREGNTITIKAEELLARALQHEIDHLDGILFLDKARRILD